MVFFTRLWFGVTQSIFLLLGLILTLALTSCSSVLGKDGSPIINKIPSNSVTDAKTQRLAQARHLWIEESDENGDPFTAGKAAYDIASLTHDVNWANEAITKLEEARTQMPQLAQATAYLGSSYAIMARDFPLQGLWQILPGPGFVRIYYVKKAESLLNDAVDQAPKDPVTRLVRAATLIKMPGIFVEHDQALKDFEVLASWEEDSSNNSSHAHILQSAKWRRSFYKSYIDVLKGKGEKERATKYQQKLLKQLSDDGFL